MRPIFFYKLQDEPVFIVLESDGWAYSAEWTGWMGVEELDEWSLSPDLKFVNRKWVFDSDDGMKNERDALKKVAELYHEQYQKVTEDE